MPDSILYLAPIDFRFDILIGLPVIASLKEIHIYDDGRISLPVKSSHSVLHNLALDGLDPVISIQKGKNTLSCYLDLGASNTQLYDAYFQKYKSEVMKQAKLKTVEFGGAGGAQKKEIYVLPSVTFSIGGKKITADSVDVLTKKIYNGEKFYGNLGEDFESKFHELILNFNYMYVEGR